MIKKVHINVFPILDGYGVMTVFSFPYTPSCEPRLSSVESLFLASYRQSSFVISTLGWYLRRAGKGGVGSYVRRLLVCGLLVFRTVLISVRLLRSRCHFHLKSTQI